jgi:hypothetical protein
LFLNGGVFARNLFNDSFLVEVKAKIMLDRSKAFVCQLNAAFGKEIDLAFFDEVSVFLRAFVEKGRLNLTSLLVHNVHVQKHSRLAVLLPMLWLVLLHNSSFNKP